MSRYVLVERSEVNPQETEIVAAGTREECLAHVAGGHLDRRRQNLLTFDQWVRQYRPAADMMLVASLDAADFR
ncbi:MAG: hypothetical protein ACOY3P_20315 [Planctomycetota bacterium]